MYPSDLTDKQWTLLEPLLTEKHQRPCRPHKRDVRREINGILYVLRTGCQWRYLPREYGEWSQVYAWYRRRRGDGTWDRVLRRLRETHRMTQGKNPEPSVAILDSQSVKTVQKGGNAGSMWVKRRRGASVTSR